MKMRNLLFGAFLGLLAVVHSTPVFPLAENDSDTEAKTEDFLADEYLIPSLTTESPKRNTTVPATQQPMSESKESDMTEGSGANYATITPTSTTTVMPDDANRVLQSGVTSPSDPDEALSTDDDVIEDTFFLHEDEHHKSTSPSVPHAQSSTSTPFPMPSDDFSSHSSTTRAPQFGVTSPSESEEVLSTDDDAIEDNTVMSTTPMFFLHGNEHYESTTSSVPHAQSSTSTLFPMPADDFSSHSSTTRAPQSGVTSPSESDEALSTDDDVIEDTFFLHEDEHHKSTTPSVPHAQSSTSTPFPMPSDDFSSHSSTTRAPQSGVTSPSESEEVLSTDDDAIEDATVMSTTPMFFLHGNEHYESATSSAPHAQSSTSTPFLMLADDSGSGSNPEEGSGTELPDIFFTTTRPSTTSTSTVETSTASSTSQSGLVEEVMIQGRMGPIIKLNPQTKGEAQNDRRIPGPTMNAGHSTPAWIIIVGFIVGVAALVMLCVAIATRDKWNGPRQATQPKANPSNQQRELEMETLVHKDSPRENGKAAEYTVIPLDELPEKYSSH